MDDACAALLAAHPRIGMTAGEVLAQRSAQSWRDQGASRLRRRLSPTGSRSWNVAYEAWALGSPSSSGLPVGPRPTSSPSSKPGRAGEPGRLELAAGTTALVAIASGSSRPLTVKLPL